MYVDPKSLIHGSHNGYGLAECGIREHSNKQEDRGPRLPDGTYDQQTIKYNINHASEMVAQYLTSRKFVFSLGPYIDDDDDDDDETRQLTGDVVIDAVGKDDEEFYERAFLRFRVGLTCIELALHSYGYKFEEHHYDWIVSHVCDQTEEYDYHDFVLDGETPKYDLILTDT
jgi:hypothetical protein